MLHRYEGDDLIVVSQPSHAWISGQLAASWGNAETGTERPSLELRLAAEQHDIAWLDWENRPTLNRETGLPYTFSQLPTIEHLQVWSNAKRWAMSYGRQPAVLISMHGTYLYDRFHDYDSDTSIEVKAAKEFLKEEKVFQERIVSEIQSESDISLELLHQHRRLLSLWDAMSLGLCIGIDDTREFDAVPATNGDITLRIRRVKSRTREFTVDPWPFSSQVVELRCEGRILDGTFDDQQAMRDALANAPARTLEFFLAPPGLANGER